MKSGFGQLCPVAEPLCRRSQIPTSEVSMRVLFATILLCVPLVPHAEESHAHHQHGAPDLGAIGTAHLATSCNASAQQEIDRGVALIHSFWYPEAEKSFRRAADADAKCGMSWWGVAMSNLHPLWAAPTADELEVGRQAAAKAKQVGAEDAARAGVHRCDQRVLYRRRQARSPHAHDCVREGDGGG